MCTVKELRESFSFSRRFSISTGYMYRYHRFLISIHCKLVVSKWMLNHNKHCLTSHQQATKPPATHRPCLGFPCFTALRAILFSCWPVIWWSFAIWCSWTKQGRNFLIFLLHGVATVIKNSGMVRMSRWVMRIEGTCEKWLKWVEEAVMKEPLLMLVRF